MKNKLLYIVIGGLILMATVSCTNDREDIADMPVSGNTLSIIPLSSSFVEAKPITRAGYLPDGYLDYNSLDGKTAPQYADIGVFMTPDRTNPLSDYIYQEVDAETGNSVWKSTISVIENDPYYMYGFMPRTEAGSASITPLNSSYANGATITLNNLNTLTPADVCVVVGARKATDDEQTARAPQSDIKLGTFEYTGGAENHNSAFILLKHVYSGLRFKISIDPSYHQLRTIKITGVQLEAEDISEKVNLSMTVTANTTGVDPLSNVTYTNVGSTTQNCTITLFPWDGGPTEFEVPEDVPQVFLACFAPARCSSFVLKSTYDVYDRKGNLIRKGCTASNKLNSTLLSGLTSIKAGDIFNINLKLVPTYLYVLSDPDLDNPTIVLN